VKTSYQEIEKHLGKQDLKVFAYPYGAYTKESVFVLKMSGIDMQVYDIEVNNFKNFNKHYIKRINIPCEMTGLEIIDEILSIPYDKSKVFVCLESKVFGIGVESYTVGSSEFCMNYVARAGITPLMDNGHYHPTEVVSDKVSSMLLFNDHLALHITRPVRWDSDHVVLYDDETREIAKEIVRADVLDKVFIATDYFDASINRISAWITGMRSVQKALLYALLEPESLRNLQNEGRFTELMAAQEELKIMPFGDIWQEYLNRENVAADYVSEVMDYEKKVLEAR